MENGSVNIELSNKHQGRRGQATSHDGLHVRNVSHVKVDVLKRSGHHSPSKIDLPGKLPADGGDKDIEAAFVSLSKLIVRVRDLGQSRELCFERIADLCVSELLVLAEIAEKSQANFINNLDELLVIIV